MSYPPRLMKKAKAAEYCDMSCAAFEREVAVGRLPQPVLVGGRDHWDRKAIDAAIDVLTGITNDWRKGNPLYARA